MTNDSISSLAKPSEKDFWLLVQLYFFTSNFSIVFCCMLMVTSDEDKKFERMPSIRSIFTCYGKFRSVSWKMTATRSLAVTE